MTKELSATEKSAKEKKTYVSPILIECGALQSFTKSTSKWMDADGGAAPFATYNAPAHCIGAVSAVQEHRVLLADKVCQNKFRQAINEVVKAGDVVLDLGSGSGIHAFFAVQAGAKKVYAIEEDTVIAAAEEVARRNGFADKIEFILGNSEALELPEKVDVIITNTAFLGTLYYMPRAREKFLKPGGKLIPSRLTISFGPTDNHTLYDREIKIWDDSSFDFDFQSMRKIVANKAWNDRFEKSDYAAETVAFPAFDLEQENTGAYSFPEAEYTISRDTTLYGLAGWYSFQLSPDVALATKPPLELHPDLWKHPFLPFEVPFKVAAGDRLSVQLGFYPAVNKFDPIWTWEVRLNGELKLKQNSFDSMPFSKQLVDKLKRAA